ncbi:LAETG motif-containing sortase-dependent surface protein [Kitasatospora sp. NPDC087314]|uniref:LAETG motif-containing sortase-dependent surface protein n=1 Tax=Kitasatospora sp. NPDC087314 TaxID=3364068 RepID=UPI0038244A80
MRTPVITRFTKNDRVFSGRRRIATLAAVTVLAGGVQFLATDSAWACGGPDNAAVAGQNAPGPIADDSYDVHGPGTSTSFVSAPKSIAIGGPKVEFGLEVGNFSKADYQKLVPQLGLFNPQGASPTPSQVTVEVMNHGQWKRVTMRGSCDPAIHTTGLDSLGQPLAVGHAARFLFRVSLTADAPKDMTELQVAGGGSFGNALTTVKVTARQAPAPKPTATATATAKPTTPAKPAPAKQPKPAQAAPAADQTPATTAAAPPTTAPATTAPAGTPELAQTGSSSANTFLAASAAVLLALGAGVLIAVRRLRPQR